MIRKIEIVFGVLAFTGLCLAVWYIGIRSKSSSSVLPDTVHSAQGQTPTEPANVISQLPVYPQAQLTHEEIVNDPTVANVEKRYLAVWNSTDQTPQISQWYQENIVQSGWTLSIPPADQTASIQQIEFQKEDTTLTVSIIRQESVSEITLDYRPGPTIEANEAEEEQ